MPQQELSPSRQEQGVPRLSFSNESTLLQRRCVDCLGYRRSTRAALAHPGQKGGSAGAPHSGRVTSNPLAEGRPQVRVSFVLRHPRDLLRLPPGQKRAKPLGEGSRAVMIARDPLLFEMSKSGSGLGSGGGVRFERDSLAGSPPANGIRLKRRRALCRSSVRGLSAS